MAEQIGTVTVQLISGGTTPVQQRVRTWTVHGSAGLGAKKLGLNQSTFAYRATLLGLKADVDTRLAAIAALQATIVSITDAFGDVKTNCLITSVGVPTRKLVINEGVNKILATITVRGERTA